MMLHFPHVKSEMPHVCCTTEIVLIKMLCHIHSSSKIFKEFTSMHIHTVVHDIHDLQAKIEEKSQYYTCI